MVGGVALRAEPDQLAAAERPSGDRLLRRRPAPQHLAGGAEQPLAGLGRRHAPAARVKSGVPSCCSTAGEGMAQRGLGEAEPRRPRR